MCDLGMLVYDQIFDMDILTDGAVCKNYTVLDNSALFDGTATSDNGILYSSLDHGAVGDNGVGNISCVKIMCRAGVIGACIDRPVIMEKIGCSFVVNQIHICIVIALEISDRCKISAMRYTTHIQLTVSAAGIDHVCKGIKRGDLFCLMDEADEKLLAHYVGIHENVAVLCIAVVVLNGENTLLTVQVQDVAVQIVLLGIINGMIKHGHICTGFDMGIDQLGVVGGVDHVIRSDNNIRIMNCFDALQIGVVVVDIGVIDIVDSEML